MQTRLKLCCLLASLVMGCSLDTEPLTPIDDPSSSLSLTNPQTGILAGFKPSDYQALTPLQQYRIANVLAASLYKGISARDFFDFNQGTDNLQLKSTDNAIEKIDQALQTPDDNLLPTYRQTNTIYFTDADKRPRFAPLEEPLVFLYELPLSRDYFDLWMAYQLVNTILFSPALELDTVNPADAQTVINRLNESIKQNRSIRDIVYEHMTSQENWRRFRSPEDNTREMMEIYLMRFQDNEVPKAAQACQNWSLSDEKQGYRLLRGLNINNQAQTELLDANDITTCEDFYRALVNHRQLLPAVILRIVNYLFPYREAEIQGEITQALINAAPRTFRDIFTIILFSNDYLTKNARVKRIEETFFNTAARIDWKSSPRFFRFLTDPDDAAPVTRITMRQVKQEALTYKLGRPSRVPLDTLSFAYYHGLIRNSLLLETPDNELDDGWLTSFFEHDSVNQLSTPDYIDYVFIATVSRKPTKIERDTLFNIIDITNNNQLKISQTKILFDYISNLPELYYIAPNP